jgi:hypothetical protein
MSNRNLLTVVSIRFLNCLKKALIFFQTGIRQHPDRPETSPDLVGRRST